MTADTITEYTVIALRDQLRLDTEDDALAYIAESFQTEWENIGTWEDEDGRTLIFMTQDAADAAADNSAEIAKITALS